MIRKVIADLEGFTIKTVDHMKWSIVAGDEKTVTWITTQQAELYKVKNKRNIEC